MLCVVLTGGAQALHGDVPQNRREQVMAAFRSGAFNLLVATDVAARGLDVPDVEMVIQTFLPRTAEAYIHRAGRTGRAGKAGVCLSLLNPEDRVYVQQLSRKIGRPVKLVAPPSQADLTAGAVKAVSVCVRC